MLGPSGSGKTVYLASMFKQLSTQGKFNFFLEVEGEDKRQRLINLYTEIATSREWPAGTRASEVSEWTFTCRVQNTSLSIYSACQFKYLDYSGGRTTDVLEDDNGEFWNKVNDADALLCLLDGQKIRDLMRNENDALLWEIKDLPSMLTVAQRSKKPVHFVISKWDILQDEYSLRDIRHRLLQIDEFRNIANQRVQLEIPIPVRLIPVSSVGKGFAVLQSDNAGTGFIMKKLGVKPTPFQVEAPLACILPDMIQTRIGELVRQKDKELEALDQIKLDPNLTFWEKMGKTLGESLAHLKDLLPEKYKLPDEILESLINLVQHPAQQKIKDVAAQERTLQEARIKTLKAVSSEETALKHVVSCFISINEQLDAQFPESNLRNL